MYNGSKEPYVNKGNIINSEININERHVKHKKYSFKMTN